MLFGVRLSILTGEVRWVILGGGNAGLVWES